MLLSCAMLLVWLAARRQRPEFRRAGERIEAAVDAQPKEGPTRDLGGALETDAFAERVARRVAKA